MQSRSADMTREGSRLTARMAGVPTPGPLRRSAPNWRRCATGGCKNPRQTHNLTTPPHQRSPMGAHAQRQYPSSLARTARRVGSAVWLEPPPTRTSGTRHRWRPDRPDARARPHRAHCHPAWCRPGACPPGSNASAPQSAAERRRQKPDGHTPSAHWAHPGPPSRIQGLARGQSSCIVAYKSRCRSFTLFRRSKKDVRSMSVRPAH